MATDPRRATGAEGERLAALHLERAGYRILERNFRTQHGELDIVAADARAIVFCEVKTRVGRSAAYTPFDSIGQRKRQKLRAMAQEWLQKRRREVGVRREDLRFDAIGVIIAPGGRLLRLEHVPNAF